jgi:excisionase family DNA binding protein
MTVVGSEQLLTARQVAEQLGISAHTALDWAESGKLPSFKLSGRAVRFRESEIASWVESQRRGAA